MCKSWLHSSFKDMQHSLIRACRKMVQDGLSQWNLSRLWLVSDPPLSTLLTRKPSDYLGVSSLAPPGYSGTVRDKGGGHVPLSFWIMYVRQGEEEKHLYWVLPLWLVWWPHSSWNGDPSMTCSHRGTQPGEVHWILMPPVRLLQALQGCSALCIL